jgi:hypothetical protein
VVKKVGEKTFVETRIFPMVDDLKKSFAWDIGAM